MAPLQSRSGRATPAAPGAGVRATQAAVADLDVDWRDARACARPGLPLDLMINPAHAKRAKALCAICPVWNPCLDEGLDEREGIWGGLDAGGHGRLRDLRSRLRTASPELAGRVRDIQHLLRAGMTPERLSIATGLDATTITTLVAAPIRRRRAAKPPTDRPPRSVRS